MREKLNSNPLFQMGAIGALLLFGAIFLFTTMGHGGGESEPEGSLSASSAPPGEGPAPSPGVPEAASTGQSALASRPLPAPVVSAWNANRTVVLLIVHDHGIDDRIVERASDRLERMSGVTTFVVPASKIARYAAITQAVGVERVPALVVLGPKRVDDSVPTASVSYGFQSDESVAQAVIDAGYKGPTVEYHP